MKHARLSEHKFKKGKFISPWNDMDFQMRQNPWFQNRLPEYLWLALILNKYDRKQGLDICNSIMLFIKELKIDSLSISEILNIDDERQAKLWAKVEELCGKECLSPLTILFTYNKYPCFASFFCEQQATIEERLYYIGEVLSKASDHQSHFATDIRFLEIYYLVLCEKVKILADAKDIISALSKYPFLSHDDVEMRMIRPMIRSAEMGIEDENENRKQYLKYFWEDISLMTQCKLFTIQYDNEVIDADLYIENIKKIMGYYSDMFTTAYPLDDKMMVLIGIATYSYKRILELVNHNLYNEISGRTIVRVLIESYIMIKYLLKHETENKNIWKEYQYYGVGQFKLVVKKAEEFDGDLSMSHVNYKYLSFLVNEYMGEDFIDMDTRYFGKQGIREKADEIGEKELFGLYYDYDSAFEHGLWGAIRESSLLKCDAAGHQYHCVPDVTDQQKLKSVWYDAKRMMNKILLALKTEYGLPEQYQIDEE